MWEFTVKKRSRIEGRAFPVFGEPGHRVIAEFLTTIKSKKTELVLPNAATKLLKDEHRGILLFYPVREEPKRNVWIGFELLFPENGISFDMNFTVRRKAESAKIVVADSDDA